MPQALASTPQFVELDIKIEGDLPGTKGHGSPHAATMIFRDPQADFVLPPVTGTFRLPESLTNAPDQAAHTPLPADLFKGPPLEIALTEALERAEAQGAYLRIRLQVDYSAREIEGLAWETLRNPRTDNFLLLEPQVVFSRFLPTPDLPKVPLNRFPSIKLLAAISSISGVDGQKPEADSNTSELERLKPVLRFNSDYLAAPFGESDSASLERIRAQLDHGYTILHLVALGAASPHIGLYFETSGGVLTLLGADWFSKIISFPEDKRPGLIVLDSAHNRQGGSLDLEPDPMVVLAPYLTQEGIPTVMAMPEGMPHDAADFFLDDFYRELHSHGLIDLAVAHARRAITQSDAFYYPVLYTSVRDPRVFLEPGPTAGLNLDQNVGKTPPPSKIDAEPDKLARIRELAEIAESDPSARRELRTFLADPDVSIRLAAGKALQPLILSDDQVRGAFRERIDKSEETDPTVLATFIGYLAGHTNVQWVRSTLVRQTRHAEPSVRLAAVLALENVAGQKMVKAALTERLADLNADVVRAAAAALKVEPFPETPPQTVSTPIVPPKSKLYQLDAGALDESVTSDQPLTSLNQDRLGFTPYVLGLRDFIASESTGTPLTVGVDGTWGSGKSSLMRMLAGQLDPQPGSEEAVNLAARRGEWRAEYWRGLPTYLLGRYYLWFYAQGDRRDPYQYPDWVKAIEAGFSYDPVDSKWDVVEAWNHPKAAQWAKAKARVSPMKAPHPTVWFNAWKFDQEEQVWAALAVEVTNQIKARLNVPQRALFWWGLFRRRFKFWEGVWALIKKFLLPILLILAYLAIKYFQEPAKFPLPEPLAGWVGSDWATYGGWLLLLGGAVFALLEVSKIIKDPFQINLKELTKTPNYQDKIGFIGQFQEDFARIVAEATRPRFGWRPRKLVVFIDDLDRCEPPKSANIVEAINIFLDSPGCVFVLGMDMRAVVASIDIRYKDVFARMQAQDAGLVAPGRIFLDKIIQVPIHLPQPDPSAITQLVAQISEPRPSRLLAPPIYVPPQPRIPRQRGGPAQAESQGALVAEAAVVPAEAAPFAESAVSGAAPATQASQAAASPQAQTTTPPVPTFDVASLSRVEIQSAIDSGSKLLGNNPRQVKRFINLFRLQVYIAHANKILETQSAADTDVQLGLTLNHLAVWVAFTLSYTEVLQLLLEESYTKQLADFLSQLAGEVEAIKQGRVYQLKPDSKLGERLTAGRERYKSQPSHWYHQRWEIWTTESDFCRAVKGLQTVWPEPAQDQTDWLERLIRLSKVTR